MRALVLLLPLAGCIETGVEKVKDPEPEGDAVLTVDPDAIDFGVHADTTPVSEAVTVTSVGDLPVTIGEVGVTGAAAYTVAWTRPQDPLDPGDALDLVVTYTPTSADDEASLTITSDGEPSSLTVALTGAGTFPAIEVDPALLSFQSDWGEPVEETVEVRSVGTADLVVSNMYVEGAQFSAEGDVPFTLAPGETTELTVTYRPEVLGETATGKLWLTTNTPQGFAVVPLDAAAQPECLGVGEAWDRGLLDAHTMRWGGSFEVENLSGDDTVCMDWWYVWRAVDSQDLGAGDMNTDMGGDYPHGSIEIGVGDTFQFPYADTDEAWWCMEKTQYTQEEKPYTFTGGYVPEPLMSYMNAQDQDGSWAWQTENPVIISGRGTNYVEVAPGGSATISLRPYNMGGLAGTAQVRETVPAGWTATGFSPEPDRVEAGDDGATVYEWDLSFDARQETGEYEDTVYDVKELSYTLSPPTCAGRQYLPMMESHWIDAHGAARVSYANPLVVNCL